MKLTPLDIRRKEFKRSMRGYADEEVDVFLDDVADEYERYFQENMELQERIQHLEEQAADHAQIRGALEKTLVSAQLQADQIIANARKESELTLKDAELKSRQIVNDSYVETQRVQQALAQLKHLEEDFRFKFQSLLDGYLNMLSEAPIAAPAPSAVAAAAEITIEQVAFVPEPVVESQPEPAIEPEPVEPDPASEPDPVLESEEAPVSEPAPPEPDAQSRRSLIRPAPMPFDVIDLDAESVSDDPSDERFVPHIDESKPAITSTGASLHSLVAEAERAVGEYDPVDAVPNPAIIYGDPVPKLEFAAPVVVDSVKHIEIVPDDTLPVESEEPFEEVEEEPNLGTADDRTLEQQKTAGQQFFSEKPCVTGDDFFGAETSSDERGREFEW